MLNLVMFSFIAYSFGMPAAVTFELVGLLILSITSFQPKNSAFAKVLFGMMMVDARGKLGGQVFSQNRGGAYVRTKVTPSNPRSVAQQQARFYLSNFSKAWASLTLTQIAAWNAAVGNFAKHNVFGNLKNPTGKNLYVKLNVNLSNIGVAPISTPPIPVGLSDITGLAVAGNGGANTLAVTWTSGAIPAAENWLLEATKQVSPGKLNVTSLFRVIANLAPAQTSPYAAGAAYNTKFGALTTGERVSIRITQVDNTTGIKGIPLTATTVNS